MKQKTFQSDKHCVNVPFKVLYSRIFIIESKPYFGSECYQTQAGPYGSLSTHTLYIIYRCFLSFAVSKALPVHKASVSDSPCEGIFDQLTGAVLDSQVDLRRPCVSTHRKFSVWGRP